MFIKFINANYIRAKCRSGQDKIVSTAWDSGKSAAWEVLRINLCIIFLKCKAMYCIDAIKYSILWYVFHHVPPSVTISDSL